MLDKTNCTENKIRLMDLCKSKNIDRDMGCRENAIVSQLLPKRSKLNESK